MKLIAKSEADMPRIGKAIRDMGWPVAVEVKQHKPSRSVEQNAKLHALLNDISKQKQWAGMWLDVEDWKRLMVSAWCRANKESVRIVPALDGQGFDVIYRRTSKLSVTEMIDLIEFVEWWCAENEVRVVA